MSQQATCGCCPLLCVTKLRHKINSFDHYMDIRKFKAASLFNGEEFLPPGSVLITNNNGTINGVTDEANAGENVEIFDGIITPGFINTHCHLELSHMKGRIPANTGLIEFLTRVIKERNFKEEEITSAMLQAAHEMYQSGIVAVGDICNTRDSLHVKRNTDINWHNFIELIGFNGQDAPTRIAYANSIMQEFSASSPGGFAASYFNTSVAPHAPYSVSHELFTLINDHSAGAVTTIHNQESDAENNFYRYKTGELFDLYKNLNIDPGSFSPSGKSSLQTYLPWLNKAAGIILVHDVFTQKDDILFIRHHDDLPVDVYFCVCINANRYIQSANPPLDLLRSQHCTITLGTDSYASNHQLNILEEMKTIQQEFPKIALAEILSWATINGARALRMDEMLGSFDIGKKPGIVLISNIVKQRLSGHSIATRLL